ALLLYRGRVDEALRISEDAAAGTNGFAEPAELFGDRVEHLALGIFFRAAEESGKRLLDDDVFAGSGRFEDVLAVRRWRGADVEQIDLGQHGGDRGERAKPVLRSEAVAAFRSRGGHAHDFDAAFGKILQMESCRKARSGDAYAQRIGH